MARRRSRRDDLADAHERNRDLQNQIEPLKFEVRLAKGLQAKDEELADRWLTELTALRTASEQRVSDAELYALAAVVHTEATEGTEARRRLVAQLQLRSVIPSPLATVKDVDR